jgi:hypothetical protein
MTPENHAILALLKGNLRYVEQQRHAATVRAHRPSRSVTAERGRWAGLRMPSSRIGEAR